MARNQRTNDLGGGLSDFGLTAPTEANSLNSPGDPVDPGGGAFGEESPLEAILGGDPLKMAADEVTKKKILESRLAQLAEAEGPSFMDQLKSPQGIAAVLGTLGVGLAGGGLEGAAGFGLGAAGQLGEERALWEGQNRAAMEQVQERLDKHIEDQLKRNKLFLDFYNQNKESLLDPETGELNMPQELVGYFMFGKPLRVSPQTQATMTRRDEAWSQRLSFLRASLEEVETLEDAKVLTTRVFQELGMEKPPNELVDQVARAYGSPDFESRMYDMLIEYGGSTGHDAAIYAGENGLSLDDPEVLRRVQFKDPTDDATPTEILDTQFLELMARVRDFEQDPANAEVVGRAIEDAETPEEGRRAIVELALPNTVDRDLYFDKMNVLPSHQHNQFQGAFNKRSALLGITDTIRSAQMIGDAQGMTEEEYNEMAAKLAHDEVTSAERVRTEAEARKAVNVMDGGARTLQGEFGVSRDLAAEQAREIMNTAIRNAGPGATQQEVNIEFENLLREFIADHKPQE